MLAKEVVAKVLVWTKYTVHLHSRVEARSLWEEARKVTADPSTLEQTQESGQRLCLYSAQLQSYHLCCICHCTASQIVLVCIHPLRSSYLCSLAVCRPYGLLIILTLTLALGITYHVELGTLAIVSR